MEGCTESLEILIFVNLRMFTNIKFPKAKVNQHDRFLKTNVENDVVVGANVWWILGVRLLALIIIMRLVSRGEFYKKLTWIGLPKKS